MIHWVKEGIGVLEGAVNIGIVKQDEHAYLIDTGIDNSAINKVLKLIDFSIHGALVTHHHADHMGGLSKLVSLGITELYGPEEEVELFYKPALEPFTMFGGSLPPKKLRNRYLEAKSCKEIKPSDSSTLGKYIDCPGHSPGHAAYIIDDVIFSGDAAFTEDTISKYKLLFAVNPASAALSIEILKNEKFSAMIPGHGPVSEDRKTAISVMNATKEHYESTREIILSVIGEKLEYERLVPYVLNHLELNDMVKQRGVTQYFLYMAPIQGYLSNLLDEKKVVLETSKNGIEIQAI